MKFSFSSSNLALIFCALASCAFSQIASAQEITVAAAASLREPLTQIAREFERKRPTHGARVTLTFGSSGTLLRQIENGAPIDVFFSASPEQMRPLQTARRVFIPRTLARGELVLVAPRDSNIRGLADLKSPHVRRVALGGPSVPAGNYAGQTLDFYRLRAIVAPKIVVFKDVRAVLAQVAAGNCDAGFVYRTEALREPRVKIVARIPARAHAPISYPSAVLKGARNLQTARDFQTFCLAPAAQAVLRKHGFGAP